MNQPEEKELRASAHLLESLRILQRIMKQVTAIEIPDIEPPQRKIQNRHYIHRRQTIVPIPRPAKQRNEF